MSSNLLKSQLSSPLKKTLVVSIVLSTALLGAPAATPDSGSMIIKNQTENKLPTEMPKAVKQSGFTVVANVVADNSAVLETPSKKAKVLKTLNKNEKIKLNGLEKDGYYELKEGGFISKHNIEITSRIASVSVAHKGEVRMSDALIQKTFSHFTQDGVTANSTDSGLTAVKTLGSLDAALFLKPKGENFDATLGVVEGKPFSAYIGEDNYGDHITGIYRTTLGAALNDYLGHGEKFSASIVTTGNELIMGSLQASLPISSDASTVSVGVSKMKYILGDTFASIDATGTSTSFWAGYNKPLWLSYQGSANYGLKLSRNLMVDDINAFDLTTNRKSTTLDNTLSYVKLDSFMGGGTNALFADLKIGKLEDDSATDPYNKVGTYVKVNLELQRVQKLDSFTAIALAKVQKAFKNLDSSEKFNLTGVNAVGGYYTGDIVGDEGAMASLEIDHAIPLIQNLSGGFIYTNGTVRTLFDPLDNTSNVKKASSIGAKLSYAAPYEIVANAELDKRVTGESVENYDEQYHFLFNIAKKF